MMVLTLLMAALAAPTPQASSLGSPPVNPLESGQYLLHLDQVTSIKLPIGRGLSSTRSLVLVELRREGDRWVQRQKTCAIAIEGSPRMVQTRIPDAFLAALPVTEAEVQLQPEAGGWRYTVDLGRQRIGWKHDEGREGLPQTPEDPRVFDADHDGNPGLTLEVSVPLFGTHEVYLVQDSHARLDGRLVPRGAEGNITTLRLDQRVLDATSRLFARHPPEVETRNDASRFRLQRVDEGTTCASLQRPDDWPEG